jgi:hypothetical protein
MNNRLPHSIPQEFLRIRLFAHDGVTSDAVAVFKKIMNLTFFGFAKRTLRRDRRHGRTGSRVCGGLDQVFGGLHCDSAWQMHSSGSQTCWSLQVIARGRGKHGGARSSPAAATSNPAG